jgi:uncharacterized protein YndB with AHSA1/START domain
MSTQAITADRKLTRYFQTADRDVNSGLNIACSVTLHSDAVRVFQALTRPEFLETWITLPGDDVACYLVAWQQNGGYQLDHYRDGSRDLMIRGDYRICRRRKLLFTWRMSGELNSPESLIYVGLHGNFTSTILELHHRGLSSEQEYLWQQEMWNSSLGRLQRIFQR